MSGGGTMGGDTDILIFVEDPGAVNSIVDLPEAMAARGYKARIVATGHAVPHLVSLGGEYSELDAGAGAAALMDATSPRVIVAGTAENRNTIGLQLIAEARKRGLQTVGIVDGPTNVEIRFRGSGDGPLAFAPEWILAPDDIIREQYVTLGHPRRRVINFGHPYFDRVRAIGRELAKRGRDTVRAGVLPEAPAGRRVVLFASEISAGLHKQYVRGDDYTLAGRGGSDKRTHVVLEEVLDTLALMDPRPYFVLCPHPKNEADEFAAYEAEIDFLDHSGRTSAELVFAADLVVGMTTMLLFEAALMGLPTLSVVPKSEETTWLASIGLGLTPFVSTREALRERLPAAVADPGRLMSKSPDEVINFGALDRMTDFLADLLTAGNEHGV